MHNRWCWQFQRSKTNCFWNFHTNQFQTFRISIHCRISKNWRNKRNPFSHFYVEKENFLAIKNRILKTRLIIRWWKFRWKCCIFGSWRILFSNQNLFLKYPNPFSNFWNLFARLDCPKNSFGALVTFVNYDPPTLSHVEIFSNNINWFQICLDWSSKVCSSDSQVIRRKYSHIPVIPTRYLTFRYLFHSSRSPLEKHIHNKCRSALHAKHNRRKNRARIRVYEVWRNFSENNNRVLK